MTPGACVNTASTGRARRTLSGLRSEGFTLMELIIVVVIIAILAALAYPAYEEHIRKSRRAEARRVLTEVAQFMERNFTLAARYDQNAAGAAMSSGVNPTSPPFPAELLTVAAAPGGTVYYNIQFTAAPTAARYEVVAVRNGGGPMSADKCGDYTLNNIGVKGILNGSGGATAGSCWDRGAP